MTVDAFIVFRVVVFFLPHFIVDFAFIIHDSCLAWTLNQEYDFIFRF